MNLLFVSSVGFILCTCVAGSVIVFTASPDTVVQGLTPRAVLRCGLNDTATSASVIGRRDTERTQYNVDRVSSIIVMHNGIDIATVTPTSAKLMVNATNIQVTGDITKATGERGFLELALGYPTVAQIGEYQCEITAVAPTGHGVIFSTTVEINISQPTIADLVNEIHNSKIREKEQGDMIHSLQQTVSSLQAQIHDLQSANWSVPSSGLQVRLLGGVIGNDGVWTKSHGAVQVRYNGATGMVCDDYFEDNNNAAHVTCRMLGFSGGTYADGNLFLGTDDTAVATGLYLLDDVRCTGRETDLTQCSHRAWGGHDCGYDELAGVRCFV